ncbi:MAG: hypothetical protein JWP88_2188, partial [Flaviaesturariibacter sp.]|nr:hypothetical protein [Flaviaesturariibacter sp.]
DIYNHDKDLAVKMFAGNMQLAKR